jgi:hypothetical protein
MSEERLGSMEAVAVAVEIVEVAEEVLHCSDHTRTRLSLLITGGGIPKRGQTSNYCTNGPRSPALIPMESIDGNGVVLWPYLVKQA